MPRNWAKGANRSYDPVFMNNARNPAETMCISRSDRWVLEENFLETHCGTQYRTYRERTRRLIPFVY